MFKVNDTVLYGSIGVCEIENIVEKEFKGEMKSYYLLKPINQITSSIFVPVDNKDLVLKMKKLLTKDEIDTLIDGMDDEKLIWIDNDNVRRESFKNIVKNGNRKDIMLLITTIYLKDIELKEKGKKIHATDRNIFTEAQKILHDEFAFVLKIESDDVGAYIQDRIKNKMSC